MKLDGSLFEPGPNTEAVSIVRPNENDMGCQDEKRADGSAASPCTRPLRAHVAATGGIRSVGGFKPLAPEHEADRLRL
jgi:hypothetical protein